VLLEAVDEALDIVTITVGIAVEQRVAAVLGGGDVPPGLGVDALLGSCIRARQRAEARKEVTRRCAARAGLALRIVQ
jgi:hypothetical protein